MANAGTAVAYWVSSAGSRSCTASADSLRALVVNFTDIEPKLRAGIEFLAANRDSGCISGRFLREQSIEGEDLKATSFVGWFDDLASLEAWSRSHSTHLAIFHSFLSTVYLLGRPPKLRLWHEVSVLPGGGVELVNTALSPLAELIA